MPNEKSQRDSRRKRRLNRIPDIKLIVFTDLDGTLLDYSNYSFDAALPALRLLAEKDIPLIICSSKTRAEIEYYREKLSNRHPFISENGGGIFIPKGYFKIKPELKFPVDDEKGYRVIRLGAKYSDLRKALKEFRREGFGVRGFGDMSIKELMRTANMSHEEARMAKDRDFDEPFIYEGESRRLPDLFKAIGEKGLKFTRGRFYHIMGMSDKGVAVSILMELYRENFGEPRTIAVGDSPNDIPMLERVDCPVIVKKQDGKYDPQIELPKLIKAGGVGPEGWNRTVLRLVSRAL